MAPLSYHIEIIMLNPNLPPDPTLAPTLNQLKAAFEVAKQQLQSFYSQRIIEKACHEYAQLAIQKNPRIMMLTDEAVTFYRDLADPKKLKEIIFQQEKDRLIQSLPLLAGANAQKAEACLQRFRLSPLKNGYPAGFFSEYLYQKGLLAATKPPEDVKPKKVVRFA